MKIQLFGLMDKFLRGTLPVHQYDSLMMPLMALQYSYTHQEKLGLRFKLSWEELSNDRLGYSISQALNELSGQKPEIGLGLSLFNKKNVSNILPQLVYHLGKIEFPEDSSELVETYLEASARSKGKTGVAFESEALNVLGTRILNIKRGSSVYDFACGYSRTLVKAMKSNTDVSAFGNDVHTEVVGMGQLFCFMSGLQHFEIQQQDTLALLDQEHAFNKKFNYVISHPPINIKIDHEIRTKYGMIRKDATIGFIIHALNSLKEDGKAVVTVSNSVLFQGAATGEIRRTLIEDDLIEAIITLPGGLFTTTAIPVNMLLLNKKKMDKRKNKMLIVDASSFGERKRGVTLISGEDIDQILSYYNAWEEDKKLSRILDVFEIRENNYNLMPSSYLQMEDAESIIGSVHIDRSNYEKKTSTIPLKQLVSIYRGLNTASSVETDTMQAKVIQLSDLRDGMLNLSAVEDYGIKTTTKWEEAEIQSGDVLITSRGIAMKFAVVPDLAGKGPYYLSANFIGLRPLPGVDPHFLLAFFESPIGGSYIRSLRKGASLPILNVKDIQDIPVPKLSVTEMEEAGLAYRSVVQGYHQAIEAAEHNRVKSLEGVYSNIGLNKGYKKKV